MKIERSEEWMERAQREGASVAGVPGPMPPLLHLYAQPWSHAEAWVVGTEDGLRALREAIDRALGAEGSSRAEAMTQDGEGYRVLVAKVEGERPDLLLPYAEATSETGKGEHPLRLVGTSRYQTLMRD